VHCDLALSSVVVFYGQKLPKDLVRCFQMSDTFLAFRHSPPVLHDFLLIPWLSAASGPESNQLKIQVPVYSSLGLQMEQLNTATSS
jgi:hypothetical protein